MDPKLVSLDLDDNSVVEKGRLGPGQMIAVDTAHGKLIKDSEIKHNIAKRKPYAEWVKKGIVTLPTQKTDPNTTIDTAPEQLATYQKAFGYMIEDVERFIKPMVTQAKEAVGSMGDDTPPSVISRHPRSLYSYFKQRFAQVTNPPIDSIRERLVMSLTTYLGRRYSLLTETDVHARLIRLSSPVLTNEDLQALRNLDIPDFQIATLPACFPVASGKQGLGTALEELCQQASEAVDAGKTLLVLSDKDVGPDTAPIPMALAVGAVHHHLIREGKRMRASLIAETGDAREEHHFAVLLGYGAAAINPYLAFSLSLTLLRMVNLKSSQHRKPLKLIKKLSRKGS